MEIICGGSIAYELHAALHDSIQLFIFPCAGKAGVMPPAPVAAARSRNPFCAGAAGAWRAPGFPCALDTFEGHIFQHHSGAIAPRERGGVSWWLFWRLSTDVWTRLCLYPSASPRPSARLRTGAGAHTAESFRSVRWPTTFASTPAWGYGPRRKPRRRRERAAYRLPSAWLTQ